jgi:hypothetical protein
MKKIIYAALVVLGTVFSFASCTEEEVKPTTELDNGGGAENEPIRR